MADAQRLGVGMGEKVRIESAAGALELQATIDAGLNAGLVLAPDVAGTAAGEHSDRPADARSNDQIVD